MKISEVRKIKILPDEALVVVFRGDLDAMEMKEVRRQLVEHVPNADMARVVVLCLDDETEVDFTVVQMEKK